MGILGRFNIFKNLKRRLTPFPFSFAFIFSFLSTFATCFLFACSSDNVSTGTVASISQASIQIFASSILSGLECGDQVDGVKQYLVFVSNADGKVVAASIHPCFANVLFQRLDPSDGGSYSYTLHVFLFGAQNIETQQKAIQDAVETRSLSQMRELSFSYYVKCEAKQQTDLETSAVCGLRQKSADYIQSALPSSDR